MPPLPTDAAKKKQEAERQKKEAERLAAERLKASINEKLGEMRTASPSEAERSHQAIKNTCTDKRLSPEFKTWALKQAKAAECAANMRATDKALNEAVRLAHQEKLKERAALLNLGRTYFAKACSLGANEEFRTATNRLIDTAMMTGGIYVPGAATRAKPLDTAPKNPKQAKI